MHPLPPALLLNKFVSLHLFTLYYSFKAAAAAKGLFRHSILQHFFSAFSYKAVELWGWEGKLKNK